MMDAARMELSTRVDRYLAGQMSADETAEFEAYMLDHPEILDDVAVGCRLKAGLASLRDKGELDGLVRSSGMRFRYLAMAASMLAAVGLAAWYMAERPGAGGLVVAAALEQLGAKLQPEDVLGEVILARTRSGTPAAIPLDKGLYRLRLLTDLTAANAAHDVELIRLGDGAVVVQRVTGLHPDVDGMLTLYFDARAAGAGAFQINIAGPTADGGLVNVVEYRLQVN